MSAQPGRQLLFYRAGRDQGSSLSPDVGSVRGGAPQLLVQGLQVKVEDRLLAVGKRPETNVEERPAFDSSGVL